MRIFLLSIFFIVLFMVICCVKNINLKISTKNFNFEVSTNKKGAKF